MQKIRYYLLAGALIVLWSFYTFQGSFPRGQVPTVRVSDTSSSRNAGVSSTGGKKPRIAIITMTTEQTTYQHLSLKNKWKYSQTHGYDLIVDFDTRGDSPVWHKLNMMEDAYSKKKYDWIWWIDFDTLLTNMTTKLEDIISDSLRNQTNPENVDWLLTADCFPLNAGSMLLRSNSRAMQMVQKIRQYGKAHPKLSEQDCLRNLIEENKGGEKRHVVMIPQWKINAFPAENSCYDADKRGWKQGDFVIHLAGAWAYLKNETDPYGEMMRRYEKYIIWP